MTNIIEDLYVEQWIYAQLVGNSTITAFVGANIFRDDIVPQGATGLQLPCVKFHRINSNDMTTMNANRVWNELWYQIEVASMSETAQPLMPIANAIDTLFHRRSVNEAVSVCMIMSSVRKETINRQDIDNSVRYQFLGGLYLITARGI